MIIFHEGMPGSGKSYEAIVKQVIPYLQKGRQCFCFVNGLDFQKFHEVTGIPMEKLKGKVKKTEIAIHEQEHHKNVMHENNKVYSVSYEGLLFQLDESQVLNVYDHVCNDAYVVLDELQDYFPQSMKALEKGITKFVTQHRHRGLDILVMGQAHEDCHNLWKRRIDQLFQFEKRDAVGRPTEYTWRSFKQKKKGKSYTFVPLRSGSGTYDKKYFGLYKSHTDETDNTETHLDDRTNLFKSTAFRVYLPAFLSILAFSIYYLYSFFSPDESKQPVAIQSNKLQQQTKRVQHSNSKQTETQSLINENKKLQEKINQYERTKHSEENYLKTIVAEYRPRLSGLIYDKKTIHGRVQFLDKSMHVHEELTLKQLYSLGWKFKKKEYGVLLTKDNVSLVVTSWPLESLGKVNNRTAEML